MELSHLCFTPVCFSILKQNTQEKKNLWSINPKTSNIEYTWNKSISCTLTSKQSEAVYTWTDVVLLHLAISHCLKTWWYTGRKTKPKQKNYSLLPYWQCLSSHRNVNSHNTALWSVLHAFHLWASRCQERRMQVLKTLSWCNCESLQHNGCKCSSHNSVEGRRKGEKKNPKIIKNPN